MSGLQKSTLISQEDFETELERISSAKLNAKAELDAAVGHLLDAYNNRTLPVSERNLVKRKTKEYQIKKNELKQERDELETRRSKAVEGKHLVHKASLL